MEDKKQIVEYKLINALWQFLKRYKDEPTIQTDGFMANLEDTINELSKGANEAQRRLIIAMFTDAANYLHAIKKRAFF